MIVGHVRARVLDRASKEVIVAVEDATNGQADITEEECAEQEAADEAVLAASLGSQDPVEVMVVPEFADNLSPLEDTLLLRGVYGAAVAEAELQIRRVRITVSVRCLVLFKMQVTHDSLLGLERVLITTEHLEEFVLFDRLFLQVPLVEIVLPAFEILGSINHFL